MCPASTSYPQMTRDSDLLLVTTLSDHTEASVQGGPKVGLAMVTDPQSPVVKTCDLPPHLHEWARGPEIFMQGSDYYMVAGLGPPGAKDASQSVMIGKQGAPCELGSVSLPTHHRPTLVRGEAFRPPLGSGPALGRLGLGVGITNRKINGLRFRCFLN